jgi:hypothetical protein
VAQNDIALIDIDARNDADPRISFVSTSVQEKLGTWTKIAAIRGMQNKTQSQILSADKVNGDGDMSLWIRVQRVN